MNKTKGQIEAEIGEAVMKFGMDFMGREPSETKTYLIDDILLVRLKGALTKAERHLAQTGDNVERGRQLIKQVRTELLEKGRPLLEAIVYNITGKKVKSLHTDISTITGDRVIIFVLDSPPKFKRS